MLTAQQLGTLTKQEMYNIIASHGAGTLSVHTYHHLSKEQLVHTPPIPAMVHLDQIGTDQNI